MKTGIVVEGGGMRGIYGAGVLDVLLEKDIGNAVGYPSQLHFSRAFKKTYGISPREWRSENKIASVAGKG